MNIGQGINNYCLFCLHHSKINNGKTIDKLTFMVEKRYFKKNVFQCNDIMYNNAYYIEYCNNQFCKLHLQGEYINPQIPMLDSVILLFHSILQSDIFLKDINDKIQSTLKKCDNYNNTSVNFIHFLNVNNFRFSELELAFDFFGCEPFAEVTDHTFKDYKNSYYSRDYKIYYRKVFNDDDSYGIKKDRIRDSLFTIYNRGFKLRVPEVVWRIEWRIRDERARRLLNITDLRLSMDDYILQKGDRLNNIFNNWIKPNSIQFNWDYINSHFPILSVLLLENRH